MVLTDWGDIARVLGGVFLGIVVIIALVVYLEEWLAAQTAPPKLTAVPPVRELDELDDQGVA
jgi:hypothetical protein